MQSARNMFLYCRPCLTCHLFRRGRTSFGLGGRVPRSTARASLSEAISRSPLAACPVASQQRTSSRRSHLAARCATMLATVMLGVFASFACTFSATWMTLSSNSRMVSARGLFLCCRHCSARHVHKRGRTPCALGRRPRVRTAIASLTEAVSQTILNSRSTPSISNARARRGRLCGAISNCCFRCVCRLRLHVATACMTLTSNSLLIAAKGL